MGKTEAGPGEGVRLGVLGKAEAGPGEGVRLGVQGFR